MRIELKGGNRVLLVGDERFTFRSRDRQYNTNGKLVSCNLDVLQNDAIQGTITLRDGNPDHAFMWHAKGALAKLSVKSLNDLARFVMRERMK